MAPEPGSPPTCPGVRLREAGAGDAETVALLHADSWRRFCRGAYADSFLDGDVVADRRGVWSARLRAPGNSLTLLAEDDAGPVGFVHVEFDDDVLWGSLVDNLHVTSGRRRGGIGSALLTHAATAVGQRAIDSGLYLWVLEQNSAARAFYTAHGGACVQRRKVPPPGGDPSRLHGTPYGLRIAWPDANRLLQEKIHRPYA
jgi:GNAT superfamily N-acetyltransferase